MAKENTVLLYGYPEKSPMIHFKGDEIDYIRMYLITIRKSHANDLNLTGLSRMESITILIRNKELIAKVWKYIDSLEDDIELLHTMFMIRGVLSTKYLQRRHPCSHCHEYYEYEHFLTYVDPVSIDIWEKGVKDKDKLLNEKIEFSNLVFLWGTLCREPDLYPPLEVIQETKPKKIECEFQVASNRKRRILEDTPLDTTDYPWVKVYGQKGIDAYSTLHTGSEIYIHGCIQARRVDNIHICPYCGRADETHDRVMEVVPYSIMRQDQENTVFLYGRILKKPEINPDGHGGVDLIRFRVLTIRQSFDKKLHLFRKNHFDVPMVHIRNPVLISHFEAFQEKHKDEKDFSFENIMVFVKGVLRTEDVEITVKCPYCQEEHQKWTTKCYIDAIGFYFWERNVNKQDAMELLNEKSEFSNIVFLHGSLCGDPALYPHTSLFVHPSERHCEFQLEAKRNRVMINDEDQEMSLYPWIRIHGARAMDAKSALHEKSEIFVYGSIADRFDMTYNICPHCNQIFQEQERISGIIPFSVEYGDHCIKPEGLHGALAESVDDIEGGV